MNAKNEYVPELFVRTITTNYARICRIPRILRKNDIPGRKTKRKKHHEPAENDAAWRCL